MGFLDEPIAITAYTKLTDRGRELISNGSLNFAYFSIGDSEIDYSQEKSKVFRPYENSPDIRHRIKNTIDSTPYSPLQALKTNKRVIRNTASIRGMFNGNAGSFSFNNSLKYFKQYGTFTNVGNYPTLDKAVNIQEGDYIVCKINTAFYGDNGTSVNVNQPYLTYKVVSIDLGTFECVTDRELPSAVYCNGGTYWVFNKDFSYFDKDPEKYWDEASYSFDTLCPPLGDVYVWNMNIIYPETMLGSIENINGLSDTYGSREFLGMISYFGYESYKQLGIIHFSNNTISNFYAEGFFEDTAKLELPLVLHYAKDTIGVTLLCDSEQKLFSDGDFEAIYYDLIFEHNNEVIGKCFPNLKIFVIDDEELLASMEYKSNRNLILPPLNVSTTKNTSITPIILDSEVDLYDFYVTYVLEGDYINSIPYQKITNLEFGIDSCNANSNLIQVSLNPEDVMHFDGNISGGTVYQYNIFKILLQKVEKGKRPLYNEWREIELTIDGVLDSTDLSNFFVIGGDDYNSASIYEMGASINIPSSNDSDLLTFNDSFIFFGNVYSDIKATIFDSSFYLALDFDSFFYSENTSWNEDYGYVDISEVGIYDSSYRMVALAKLPKPLRKEFGQNRTIILNLDF